jgi:serine/threonine protein kinase
VADFPIDFGRYQLVEHLAMGGMAELFVATAPGEHGFKKRVVIKRLLPHLVVDETYTAMFIDEAKLTARLVHPKIAQTFELGKVDDALYIAMEYIDGIDVLALLREFATRSRRVEPQLAAWIAHEVLDALDYAHNATDDVGRTLGIVHRDISPSNILLSARGDIKLVDFGIARAKDPERAHKSKSGTLKGKYGYMSPEQVVELPLDGRSDVFSVGVVLAELLTGRRLFAAANELDVLLMVRDVKLARLDKYGTAIEPGLQHIVRKALKKSLDERWSSAAAFRDALAEWLFEQRHRMTNKQVADVVADLRDPVAERRRRATAGVDAAAAAAVAAVEQAVAANPHESADGDGMPLILVEDDLSMPVISVSYDDVEIPRSAVEPKTPSEVRTAVENPVSIGAHRSSDPPRSRGYTKPPVRSEPPPPPHAAGPPPPPPAKSRTITPISRLAVTERVSGRSTRSEMSRTQYGSVPPPYSGGAVGSPRGDTISSAVEAAVSGDAAGFRRDSSDRRSFDDLTDSPPRKPPSGRAISDAAGKEPPTPPALADISDAPDDAGDFAVTPPLRVLYRLLTAGATGLLVVTIGGIKKEIYVRDGQPEYVSSNVASELLGNYLVTKGVLSDGELAMALAMMPHYGGKLGDTLVGLGLLKPLEVFRHLTRQVRSKIIDVCTWNKGGYAWYEDRTNSREAFPLDFNAFEVLGAGALAFSDDVADAWLAKNGHVVLRASRSRRIGPERFEVNGLVELFDELDGKRSVSDHVASHSDRAQQLKIGRMLCLLEACDLARPV